MGCDYNFNIWLLLWDGRYPWSLFSQSFIGKVRAGFIDDLKKTGLFLNRRVVLIRD